MRNPRSTRFLVIAAVLVSMTAIASSCGIPLDDQPRLAASENSNDLSGQDSQTAGSQPVWVYFVKNGQLLSVRRPAEAKAPADVTNLLISGVIQTERNLGLESLIPSTVQLRGVNIESNTVTVNLSGTFDDVVGTIRAQAIGQLTMSLTELNDIESLAIQVEGRPALITSPTSGDVETVSACDFLPLLPTVETLAGIGLVGDDANHLVTRRTTLTSRCPPQN